MTPPPAPPAARRPDPGGPDEGRPDGEHPVGGRPVGGHPVGGRPEGQGRPPRVVLFRANAIDTDSRAKKFALTLARLGYEVHVLSAEDPDPSAGPARAASAVPRSLSGRAAARARAAEASVAPVADRRLGPVAVHTVTMTHARRDVHKLILGARRRRQLRIVDPTPIDEYVTRVYELRGRARRTRERSDEALVEGGRGPRWAVLRGLHAAATGILLARKARWRAQWMINVGYRQAWREWDARRENSTFAATTRGVLPEVEDYAASFSKVLDRLAPDVIHAHHPLVLGTAVRAARRRRANGHPCAVVYDARENFGGIPPAEQGNVRRHHVLVREESRYVRSAAAVITVSEPIADVLAERYGVARPTVVLNVPVAPVPDESVPGSSVSGGSVSGGILGPTVRQAAGIGEGTPLMVYSGAVSAARGIDTLVDALPFLPEVHLALVTVPFPHPRVPELVARARAAGSAGRIHVLPPVGQDELLHYLSGADVAVHPLPGGSPNHDQALPNKLFEYLHAGLPLVVADAVLMAAFVRDNRVGEVFASGDARGLAEAVRTVLAPDYPLPSRADIVARCSWQAQEARIAELYQRVAPITAPWRRDPTGIPFGDLRVRSGEDLELPSVEPTATGARVSEAAT